MRPEKHIRRAVEKGYGPAREHAMDPLTQSCKVCLTPAWKIKDSDVPLLCFPRFGGETKS